jgi:hypothetical protein
MKTNMKLKPVAAAIIASIALAACNGETTANLTDIVGSEDDAVILSPATINIGVKFPEPEAGAAWIDADTDSVMVQVYSNNYVGSLEEAEDMADAIEDCDRYKEYDDTVFVGDQELMCDDIEWDGLMERRVKEVFLDADSPTTSIDLFPGKYRISATFLNEHDEPIETSVSYATLDEGTHSISLRGASATWTAATPIELQLLNDDTSEIDWDPTTEGIQTPADVMGITGAINGLHLPSLSNYPASLPNDMEFDEFSPVVLNGNDEWFDSAILVPVLRIDEDGTEVDLHPVFESHFESYEDEAQANQEDSGEGDYDNYGIGFFTGTQVAGHFQEYVDGENASYLDLGARMVGLNSYSEVEGETGQFAMLLFGVPFLRSEEDGEIERDIWQLHDTYTYSGFDADNQYQEFDTGLTVAEIGYDMEERGYETLFSATLGGEQTEFVNGSTITGHLIEIVEFETMGNESSAPAALLDASLNNIAVAAGLVAQASSDNCGTLEASEIEYSNQYLWDEANMQWIAGTLNPLALEVGLDMERQFASAQDSVDNDWSELQASSQASLDAAKVEFDALADLNGENGPEAFEAGIFIDEYWNVYCNLDETWDSNDGYTFTVTCNGLETAEEVKAYTYDADVTMCATPFTLTAENLAIEYPVDGGIIID